jgi:hypothetical protein
MGVAMNVARGIIIKGVTDDFVESENNADLRPTQSTIDHHAINAMAHPAAPRRH